MSASETKAIEDLEAQVAFNEKTLNELSEVVAAQAREIETLKAEIEVIGRQVLQLTEGEAGSH